MSTWAELVDELELLVNEAAPNSNWSAAVFTAALKWSEREMIYRAKANRVFSAVNLVVGSTEATATYTWPTNAMRLIEVRVASAAAPMEQKSEDDLAGLYGEYWRSKTGDEPLYFLAPSSKTIRVVPMPTAIVTNGLEWTTVDAPDQAGGSPVGVNAELQAHLLDGAMYYLLRRDRANQGEMGYWYVPPSSQRGKGGGLFWDGIVKCMEMMRSMNMKETFSRKAVTDYSDWLSGF